MQRDFDVAVAGAGPAGASCALHLARLGYAVALIDAKTFPRPKLCGEYLNAGAVRELREIGAGGELAPLALPLDGMRLHAHGERADFAFGSESWSLPRVVLDDRLRQRALNAGATPILGTVRSIEDRGTSVDVAVHGRHDPRCIRARYVIGADGMHSTVARLMRLTITRPSARFAVGGHYGGMRFTRWIEMYAGGDGYVAINPLGNVRANTVFVLGRERLRSSGRNLGEELERFSWSVSEGRRAFSDSQLEGPRRSVGPLAHTTRHVTRGNIVLVGDAAGFVDPFTGQGVYLALVGAKLLAAALSRAFDSPVTAQQSFERYSQELRSVFAERTRLAWLVRSILTNRFLSRRAASAIRRRPGDYGALIDAFCGASTLQPAELAAGLVRALR